MANIRIDAPILPWILTIPEEYVEHLDEGPELWECDGKMTSIPGKGSVYYTDGVPVVQYENNYWHIVIPGGIWERKDK